MGTLKRKCASATDHRCLHAVTMICSLRVEALLLHQQRPAQLRTIPVIIPSHHHSLWRHAPRCN